jgi:hypothetical protein
MAVIVVLAEFRGEPGQGSSLMCAGGLFAAAEDARRIHHGAVLSVDERDDFALSPWEASHRGPQFMRRRGHRHDEGTAVLCGRALLGLPATRP